MKLKLFVTLLALALAPSGWAVTNFNQTITYINGSGSTDGGWTADTSNGLQLGLRAKGRPGTIYVNQTPTDGAGTYTFATQVGVRGPFNYEFTINSDILNGADPLSTYDFFLSVDRDSSMGISYDTVNPLSHWTDNSYGNNSTPNDGSGVEGTDALASSYNKAANSQNITFGDYPTSGALPLEANATYNYNLYAVTKGDGVNGARLANVGIQVVIGSGGAAVPDAGSTIGLLGIACLGIAGLRRKFNA